MGKEKKPSMTCAEAGRLGGEAVKKKYGPEFYDAIGRKGGEATRDSHGPEFYEEIGHMGGSKGGNATKAKYGSGFYEQIGKKGGERVKELLAKARAMEAEEKKARDETPS